MSLRYGVFLALACWLFVASAQEIVCPPPLAQPTAALLESARSQASNHGFLWRVTKSGHASYLYGTFHLGRLEWTFPGAAVQQALKASNSIALEINVRDPALVQQLQAGMAAGGIAPLEENLQRRLQLQALRSCIAFGTLQSIRPELQLSALTLAAARSAGLEAAYGTEAVLVGYAVQSNLPIESLETVSEQLNGFLAQNDEELRSFVESGLQDLERGEALKLLLRLSTVWAQSDFAALNRYEEWCNCLKTASDRVAMRRLVDQRNPNLATRFDMLHEAGRNVFAAVGALHMIGPGGLPARLQRMGYRVQRIF